MARPTVTAAIKEVKKANGFISQAARALDTSRTTLHAMINEHPTLKEAVIDAREAMKDFAESQLLQNIKDGKEASIFFYLKTQAKDRGYIERSEVTGASGEPVTVKVIKGVSVDDL